ncbi:MAG TPA: lysozyme inhibitor LprI family protein, partial [Candidatus Udaeobacter sp.]|nr:lysozyme inhibitor LprI family protein [Candidatus Udaeobacter sp.]
MRLLIVLTPCVAAVMLLPSGEIYAQTQAAMNAQARAQCERADAELNKTYQAVLAKLRDTESK